MDLPNTKLNHIMFSLQQNDDQLVVDDHPNCLISFQQEDQIVVDLGEHVPMVEGTSKTSTYLPTSSTRKRGGNPAPNNPNLAAAGPGADGEEDQTETRKKMVHREIEKQRRQEMTKLYASLRGLLPIEFVKGKRSTSDHMHQAVDYIKQMQENIKGLNMKRDKLKKHSENIIASGKTRMGISTNESLMNQLPNTVSVSSCNGGVEILINSCLIEDGFILSGLLNTLVEEGLNITSCISTKVNDHRLLHSIQSQTSDLAVIDLSMLQQRLVLVANTQPNFS